MDTPVLAVRHVSKSFAGVRALVDIDLEIAPGESEAVERILRERIERAAPALSL